MRKYHSETQHDMGNDYRKILTPSGDPDVTNITNIEMYVKSG